MCWYKAIIMKLRKNVTINVLWNSFLSKAWKYRLDSDEFFSSSSLADNVSS